MLKPNKRWGFSVQSPYGQIYHADRMQMPLIWEAWESMWGRILTLDNVKRRGLTLVNSGLCLEAWETVDHSFYIPRRLTYYGIFLFNLFWVD